MQATSRVGAIGGTIEVHLDSPTGPLVGQTPLVTVRNPTFPAPPAAPQPATASAPTGTPAAPTAPPNMNAAMRRMAQSVKANVASTAGTHDVFFVFKNPMAGSDQVLMQVVSSQFLSAGSANAGEASKQ